MATLELQFNCLCLFVPDPENYAVHVLMPATNGQGHEGHGDGHKHVVRMLHHSFEGEEERRKGRSMEGWALSLGSADGNLNPVLVSPRAGLREGVLPDLGKITKKTVDPSLLGLDPGPRVAARITLYSGRVHRIASEARWQIGEEVLPLAHQVIWKLDVDPRSGLTWERLKGRVPADASPPLQTLKELEPEDNREYKLRIFHVTEKALPPRGGTLKPREMRDHYRAFYPLLGEHYPADDLLPRIADKQIDRVNCGSGQASPPPPSDG